MIRTAVLLSVMAAIMLAAGFFIAGVVGMIFALVLAFAINFVSFWYSDRIVLRIYRAKRADDKELEDVVGSMAREAGIPRPDVYVIPSDVPNALATGRDPQHAAVAVSEGLKALSREEMKGVIAHEISHIKNRDTLIQTVAATIAGAISFMAQLGYWSLFFDRNRRDQGGFILGALLIIIFAPLAALIVKMAISRRREYRADFGGAIISKHPLELASALRKISKVSREKPMHASPATSHMWIVNPFKQDWFTSLFSTHPPIQKRIAKLERMGAKKKKGEELSEPVE